MIETLAIAYYGLGAIVGVGCLIYTFAQKQSKDDSYYLRKLKKLSKNKNFNLCNYCSHHVARYKANNALGFERTYDRIDCKIGDEILKSRGNFQINSCKEFELDKSKF